MLKLIMLQAIQPVKFTGNPSDYPTFRDRIRDNLEDNVLTDSQKVEFLPKFLAREPLEVVERVSGCTCNEIITILEERYGQPATVAAACIKGLTEGPRLANSDYTGLLNFAEQLEAASKRLTRSYELEASTVTNLRQIVKPLPGYLINKWGDASYAIREKGSDPKLSDLAKFVKRQAAIKNDPAFVNVSVDRSNLKGKQERQFDTKFTGSGQSKQTSSFANDMKSSIEESASVKLNAKPNSEPDKTCHCCSGHHPLAECTEFRSKNLASRWDIYKQNKLCHVCLQNGHMRVHCECVNFCECPIERKHHKLLHYSPRENRNELREDFQSSPKPMRQVKQEFADTASPKGGTKSSEDYATDTKRVPKTVLLHVVPVKVLSLSGASVTTYAMIDNGSHGTVISSDIAKSLNLEGQKEHVSVSTLMGKTDEEFEVVQFQLQSASGEREILTVEDGLISEKFNISEQYLPKHIDLTDHPHLKDIKIPEVEQNSVSILIEKDVDYEHEVI